MEAEPSSGGFAAARPSCWARLIRLAEKVSRPHNFRHTRRYAVRDLLLRWKT